MAFSDRLIRFIHRAATSSKRVRLPLTPIGATFFGLLTALFVVLSRQVDRILGFSDFLSESLKVYLSLPLLLAGLALILWTVLLFLRAKGSPVPINPPRRLVTSGPYAYCRNPMLTGVFLLLFGLAILFGSVSLFFIFTPLYILLHVVELKTIEEPELTRRLGDEYLAYKKRTPMFIPRLRAQSHQK
ncbi:MAG: isoprenylcysteine carboxylmethyltransferase family protein [Candidatus Zixiibacteriota bacterium]|nr:MAG: isoprenylcysteine carboxylmethyltransferase family protein [candidate division Zixibacteria bacterium]